MVECSNCEQHFHVGCLGGSEAGGDLSCTNCSMRCCRRKRLRRTASAGSEDGFELLDMNASPPREFDGADAVNSELALAAGAPKMQDTCSNPFTLTSLNTHTDMRYVANETSTCTSYSTMQIASGNLDIATQRANLVYLQALKEYVSERRGVLADGWRVKFEYSENICKTSPIYCAPDGRRFDSMPEVAHHLGLLSACNSIEENDNGSSIALLQDGSHATKSMENASRSLRTDMLRVHNYMSQSRVSNHGNAVEVEPIKNGNSGSELFLADGFPVQFEDFFVTSIGKIDTRLSFHNACQIWPVGYKSIWHDKFTGSVFICNVLDGDDCGPIFRVSRYPCTKQPIPIASTVICRSKCGWSDEIVSCLATESARSLQRVQCIPSDSFINHDVIGEFSVEGRSPSFAWQMVLEALLCACRQAFRDLSVVNFCCNHNVDEQQCYASYSIDSLDKFGSLAGPVNSMPNLILTSEQLEASCMVLRKWLQPDRFGLDAQFVQELIERLPGVAACSEYKFLYSRCQNSTAHTVGSGFFAVIRKYNSQPMVSDSLTENRRRLSPPGNAIASNLPFGLIGDVLQAYEFCLRFHKVLGQEAPFSSRNLENELLNPLFDGLKPLYSELTTSSTILPDTRAHDEDIMDSTKESDGDGSRSEASIKCTGSILSNFHMAMLKVLVEDMLAKAVIRDAPSAMESKTRKGRKKSVDINLSSKKIKLGIFPVNEITWPELARRYILVLLSMDQNLEAADISSRELCEMFRCLNGDGGTLCGSFTGMAAVEADAVILAEASKKIFSSVKSKMFDLVIDKKDLNISGRVTEKNLTDNKCPDWIKVLEPVRKQATNVGARIRDRVRISLEKQPPAWAKEKLLKSISKEVYKGNAAGPTKNIVVEVLNQARDENPLAKKKAKESRVIRTVSDVIMKRCRMVLRSVAAEDESRTVFGLMAESLLKPHESDDVEHPATFLRVLDFRTIDLRLDAGFYGDSLESFIEDVREVWQNLRITCRNKPKYLDLIETLSKKLEELYEQEVLTLVSRAVVYGKDSSLPSDEAKKELNTMLADTVTSTLFVAPWEDGICKVCGKDENDHILLLCDRCDAEYHTYCLDPPLQRVPKSSWYCPDCISFITSQAMPREEDRDIPVLSQVPEKKKIQREFTRNGLQALVDLADSMESMEYWELGVQERILLLRFLCDEALSSSVIRDHIRQDGCDIRRNFLGQDSAGRLYWVLGRAERVFVSGPHSTGEECVAAGSSSGEFDASEHSSWICYESDVDVEALVEWLRDDVEKEKELKQAIIKWQRNKLNDPDDNNGQVIVRVNRSRLSVNDTNARKALERKFGLCENGEAIPFPKDGGDGRVVNEQKIYRCGCLEIVGPARSHCFKCHSTSFGNEVHRCELRKECGGSLEPQEAGGFLKKHPGFTNDQNEPGAPFDSEEVRADLCGESSLKEVLKDAGLLGSTGNAAFLVEQGVDSNARSTGVQSSEKQAMDEPPPEVDGLNPEGINGNNPSSSSGNGNAVVVCESSLAPLVGRASEILGYLKSTLLDIEAALPSEAFRASRGDKDRVRGWREFVKLAQSIYEMVQATIVLEDMIKTEHLRKEWWYWSSPSAAAKISTISSLALRIYALDAALFYENPPLPPAGVTERAAPGDSKSNDSGPTETSRSKKKLKSFQ